MPKGSYAYAASLLKQTNMFHIATVAIASVSVVLMITVGVMQIVVLNRGGAVSSALGGTADALTVTQDARVGRNLVVTRDATVNHDLTVKRNANVRANLSAAVVTSTTGVFTGKLVTGGTWYRLRNMSFAAEEEIRVECKSKDPVSGASAVLTAVVAVGPALPIAEYREERAGSTAVAVFVAGNTTLTTDVQTGTATWLSASPSGGYLFQTFFAPRTANLHLARMNGPATVGNGSRAFLCEGAGYSLDRLLAMSGECTIPAGWHECLFPTKPELVAGANYTLGEIPNTPGANVQRYYTTNTYPTVKLGRYMLATETNVLDPTADLEIEIVTQDLAGSFEVYVHGDADTTADCTTSGTYSAEWAADGTDEWPTSHPDG